MADIGTEFEALKLLPGIFDSVEDKCVSTIGSAFLGMNDDQSWLFANAVASLRMTLSNPGNIRSVVYNAAKLATATGRMSAAHLNILGFLSDYLGTPLDSSWANGALQYLMQTSVLTSLKRQGASDSEATLKSLLLPGLLRDVQNTITTMQGGVPDNGQIVQFPIINLLREVKDIGRSLSPGSGNAYRT